MESVHEHTASVSPDEVLRNRLAMPRPDSLKGGRREAKTELEGQDGQNFGERLRNGERSELEPATPRLRHAQEETLQNRGDLKSQDGKTRTSKGE